MNAMVIPDARPSTAARDPLLEPFAIKKLRLRNRIVSTSHASMLDDGGLPLERYQRYHEEKARGGLAMTMIGGSAMTSPDSSWAAASSISPATASFRISRRCRSAFTAMARP